MLAAASPPQEKLSAAATGSTSQRSTKHCQCSNDYRVEVSEVHQKIDTVKHFATSNPAASIVVFLARGSKFSVGEAECSGKRGFRAAFNEALPVQ